MNCCASNHFSHKFELKVDKLPVKKSDRISWNILYPGMILGAFLMLLGLYELYGFHKNASSFMIEEDVAYQSFMSATFFDISIIILGLGIVIALLFSHLRYKKIRFDGNIVELTHRPAIGKKRTYVDSIRNYEGVLYRIEFFQFGFINKTKHIIELFHKDCHKTAPLYISTSDKDVRKIWEEYAKTLNKPTIICTDEGLMARGVDELDKSIRDLAKTGKIVDNYDSYEPLPSSIGYARKKDKLVIKARKIIWDVYNIIAWVFIFMSAALLVLATTNLEAFKRNFSTLVLAGILVVGALILISAVWILFRKDKLVIKKNKIVHTHKYMLFSRKNDEIYKDDIEAIEITFNPTTERHFLAIVSDNKTIIFGKKLPTQDLRWVKKLLVHEIIK